MQLEVALSGNEEDGLMIEVYRTHFRTASSYLNSVDPSGVGPISRLGKRSLSPMPNVLITVYAPLTLFLIQALTGLGLSRLEGWTMF